MFAKERQGKIMEILNGKQSVSTAELMKEFNVSIEKEYVGKQIGDVERTQADNLKLYEIIMYRPNTELQAGIHYFSEWYKVFYKM